MEQAREAIFSSLAARVPGARVLDLFAGSGSFGLEAWSRGAASVTAVEKVSKHWKILQGNFQSLEPARSDFSASRRKGDTAVQCLEKNQDAASVCLGAWQAVQADVYDFLKRAAGSFEFDLIFADPPYDEPDLPKLLTTVGDVLAPDGLLIFEMRAFGRFTVSEGWTLLKEKKYGETRVLFLQPVKGAVK